MNFKDRVCLGLDKPIEALRIVHYFDPCVACSVH
ncbi:MAG: hypothetical protein D3926_16105 [Desulfobacteraceae bacterium]|nr:MAG: hypothetical protein D3926_16105 [Desulfobacteraceae bacterium]